MIPQKETIKSEFLLFDLSIGFDLIVRFYLPDIPGKKVISLEFIGEDYVEHVLDELGINSKPRIYCDENYLEIRLLMERNGKEPNHIVDVGLKYRERLSHLLTYATGEMMQGINHRQRYEHESKVEIISSLNYSKR